MDFYTEPWVYDLWFKSVNDDAEFWPELARRTGGKSVLELACGSGRLTIPLVRELAEDGIRVVGLDIAPQMLAVAEAAFQKQPAEVQAQVTLVQGDMRSFDLGEKFDFAFVGFNSMAHFHDLADQLACFRSARQHLVPGGRFAVEVNFYSPDHLAESLEERPMMLQGHSRDEVTGETTLFLNSSRYYPDKQILDELLRLERVDSAGKTHVVDVELPQHVYYPRELQLLVTLAGFEVETVYGDNSFGPLTADSEVQIVVGRAV